MAHSNRFYTSFYEFSHLLCVELTCLWRDLDDVAGSRFTLIAVSLTGVGSIRGSMQANTQPRLAGTTGAESSGRIITRAFILYHVF